MYTSYSGLAKTLPVYAYLHQYDEHHQLTYRVVNQKCQLINLQLLNMSDRSDCTRVIPTIFRGRSSHPYMMFYPLMFPTSEPFIVVRFVHVSVRVIFTVRISRNTYLICMFLHCDAYPHGSVIQVGHKPFVHRV